MSPGATACDNPLISLVVPCYNEAEVFPHLRAALVDLASRLEPRYRVEFVLVDDGSRDATWDLIVAFAAADPRVRAAALSRNFGHQTALTGGYDLARGDAVVSLDADLQDPPEVILQMIDEWQKGADVVFAIRSSREGETAFKRWTASVFYRLIRALGQTAAPANSGDFRLMSRRSVAALRQLREKHRYLRGLVGWIGFRTSRVEYDRKPRRAGVTKYPLRKMLAFALDAIVSSSALPLRLTYILAVVAALPFIGYLFYALVMHLFFGVELVTGWSSLILAVVTFGSLILFCLGLIGEYVGRIYEQSKDRPLYLVREVLDQVREDGSANGARLGDKAHDNRQQ
jgi:dolichol-phosphate mannosyltransferase